MKGLTETLPFHLLTNPHVINRFIFGHGVVIYYLNFNLTFPYLTEMADILGEQDGVSQRSFNLI